jgi:hypothetical protein
MRTKDQLNGINAHKAVEIAYDTISFLQQHKAHEQVAGLAVLMKVMADRTGVSVSELLSKAERIERDADTFFRREIKALRDYIDQEITKA